MITLKNLNEFKMHESKTRCAWVGEDKPFYLAYHDEEWGVPVHNDTRLFEMLILEGAQAGLSWETILKKREGYRKAFHHFDPLKCARMTDQELENLMKNDEIVRNRLKIFSVRKNAQVFLNIQKEYGTFDSYLWRFADGQPRINKWKNISEIPAASPHSDAISKDLKKRGMSFVGTTIIYAFMQAVGMVNDHTVDCWRYQELC